MEKVSIYSIGHGAMAIEDFCRVLKDYKIQYVVDVRSSPFSKYNPHFNQSELKHALQQHEITYLFMGDVLGGRPNDPACYDDDGKVDYDKVKIKDSFKEGIERLKTAAFKGIALVVMCSESKPAECHRSKLIGRVLLNENVYLNHIDEKGKIKSQIDVINELNKGLSDTTLFPEEVTINSTSRKAYR